MCYFETANLSHFEVKFNDLVQFSTENLIGCLKMSLFVYFKAVRAEKLVKTYSQLFLKHPVDQVISLKRVLTPIDDSSTR